MHNKRNFAQEFVILFIGAVIGYFFALHGPRVDVTNHTSGPVGSYLTRFGHYQKSHPTEVIIGAVLLGVILFLIFSKRGKKR